MRDGTVYANAHTFAHPGGEIRGRSSLPATTTESVPRPASRRARSDGKPGTCGGFSCRRSPRLPVSPCSLRQCPAFHLPSTVRTFTTRPWRDLAPKPQHGLERTRRPSALEGASRRRHLGHASATAGRGKPRAKKGGRLAVAFRVLAETASGRGARAATAVTSNGTRMTTSPSPRPPPPPFDRDAAIQKVRLAEETWNRR